MVEYSRLKVGEAAPDFTIPSTTGGEVTLSSFRGQKNVVLLFYPKAFTKVCSIQLPTYQAVKPEFDARGAELLGISTDDLAEAGDFARQLGLEYQLLSDQQRSVVAAYGLMHENGWTDRAAFVVDKQGIIRHLEVTPASEQPDRQGVLQALEQLV